ncbi:kelch-like protein diablo [Dendronephthya gigantea]|uniref:kelch-like protein diablo n=1 Tax=Dendronephthya gigantea TaxID=151771 RepID=UPI00106CF139|nr:kelch-like protein diablo [Dendronephthya gigantea]
MDVVKDNMAESREKVDENDAKLENMKAVVENPVERVEAKVELVQGEFKKQEESNRQLEESNRQQEERYRQLEERNRQQEERNRQQEERNRQQEERYRQLEESNRQQEERNRQQEERNRQQEERNRQQEEKNRQLEKRNRRLEVDNVEMKKCLKKITKQLEQMSQLSRVVVVAGGWNGRPLNSVEMFNPATATWSLLQPMKECRRSPSSVIYNNQFLVTGGCSNLGFSQSMEKLSLNDIVQDYKSIPWENFPAQLPHQLAEHCTEVVNGRLIMIGGYDANVHAHSNKISEIPLVPPYDPEELTTMPQKRYYHGVAMFGEQIIIVGGKKNPFHTPALQSVFMYDITKNQCQKLAPLPYPVSEMATVEWGEDNVIIMGGVDSEGKVLSKVLMYNIKTQTSHMLPDMKYKRKGCVAAVARDTVIVMGGEDERGKALKSVESFRFDRYSWGDLPEMHEARYCATAVTW